LVYKDASDVSDADDLEGDQSMGDSDEEAGEEIKEIPLGAKRRFVDYDDEEDGED
jgi:hypothetical protein